MRKLTKLAIGFVLTALFVIGIFVSQKDKSNDSIVFSEMTDLTKGIVKNIGDSPTLEKITIEHQVLEQRKNSIKEKMTSLIDSGKLRKEKCSETSPCSAFQKEFEQTRDENIDRISNLYEKYQDQAFKDLRVLSDKKEQLINNHTSKAIKEVNDLTKSLQAKVEILDQLDALIESYKSMF